MRQWTQRLQRGFIAGTTLAMLLTLGIALAFSGTLRSTPSSGGGSASGGGLKLQASIGQPIIGSVSDGSITLCGGILCGVGAPAVVPPEPTNTPTPGTTTPTATPGTTTPTATGTPGSGSDSNVYIPVVIK